MRVEAALTRLGGVADVSTLVALTSRRRLDRAVADGRVVRDARGRYALPGVDEARRAAARLNGVLCLDSAARFHGWGLKHEPTVPAVAVPRNRKVSAERREGARVVYLDLSEDERRERVTSPLRTVLDCAARLPFDEALAIADSALRAGAISREDLLSASARQPKRHRAKGLAVAQAADGRAANPFESVLRALALEVAGLDVEPQYWIGERRVDLADPRLGLVIEADSFEFHGERRQLKRDCERYNALTADGWVVVRFAWEHVMFEPEYVRAVLASAVTLCRQAA